MNNIVVIIEELLKRKDQLVRFPTFADVLQVLKKAADEPSVPKQPTSRFTDWTPSEHLYNDRQKQDIGKMVDDGYHPREAEHMANVTKAPKTYEEAAKSPVKPTEISDRYLNDIRHLAKAWVSNYEKYREKTADPKKNPALAAAGHQAATHEKHLGDFNKAKEDFLSSISHLEGRDHHKALSNWKKQWKDQNPDHESNVQNFFDESKQGKQDISAARQGNINEQLEHIAGYGDPDASTMSTEAGIQEVGGTRGEDGETSGASIEKDPLTSFATKNPKLVEYAKQKVKDFRPHLNEEQARKLKQIETQHAAQKVVRRPKKEG